jgi:predicted PurR-regulated permease PerM
MPQALTDKPLQPSWRASLIWLGLSVAAWLILKLLAPVLTPFVIALVLAYSLSPVVQHLHRLSYRVTKHRLPNWLAVLVVELGFITIALAVLLLIVPILGKELPLLQAQLPHLAERLNAAISPLLASFGLKYSLDPASVKSFVVTYLEANASDIWTSVLPSLKLGGGLIFTLLGLIVLVPVVLFYLLSDWANMLKRVEDWIPRARLPVVKSFINEADAVMGQYLRGQLLVMALLAIFYSIGLSLWGLDLALPIGVFTGLAICIPYIGFGIGLILALLVGVLQFDLGHTALILATVYGTGQVLEGFFLTPRLVGERIGLHPLAVIFALLAFGQLFGFIGVLVALPASAVLLVGLRRLKKSYLASKLYQA